MLLEANRKKQNILIEGELLECDRGQKIYSIKTWAEKFGKNWTTQKVRHFFSLLENDFMIERKGLRKTTRLTIINYDAYQTDATQRNHTENKQKTTIQEHKELKNKDITEKHPKHDLILRLLAYIEKTSNVSKMKKQLTYEEAGKLLDTYGATEIKDTLERMENWKPLTKKNVSVYLTLRNWMNR